MCHNIKLICSPRAAAKLALISALGIAALGVSSIEVSHAAVPCLDRALRHVPNTHELCMTSPHHGTLSRTTDGGGSTRRNAADHAAIAQAITLRLNRHLVLWGEAPRVAIRTLAARGTVLSGREVETRAARSAFDATCEGGGRRGVG
jgi:hypothetical protein